MFNFKELKLNKEVNEGDPFVGIRRSTSGNMEFRLPRGFANFPENDFDATKELFFRMYRTFKKFERDHPNKYLDTDKKRKDNIEKKNSGYTFSDSEGNSVVLYSKISVIENLLDVSNDLSLDVIERQIGINENIDYAQIDKYLDKAIYQEETNDEHVIYIDSMNLPKNVIQYKSATLIDMFCFILDELNNELEQGTDSRVRELSSKFKEQYLSYDQSLFNEDTFEETIIVLKDLLQSIDRATAYKDNDYWQLYEAVESFLYGELDMNTIHDDGSFWGICNFYQIWEDMCNTYIFSHPDDYDVVYADTNIKINGKRVGNYTYEGGRIFKKEDFENTFFIGFRQERRWLRPDLVHRIKIDAFFPFTRLDIISNNGNTLDFAIHLMDPSKEGIEIYNFICDYFKIKQKGFRPNFGIKQNKSTLFKKYPKSEFFLRKNKEEESFKKISPIKILDYKYIDYNLLLSANAKIDTDITKQLCYEFYLKNSHTCSGVPILSQFIIPCYNKGDDLGDEMNDCNVYYRLIKSKIEIFKANFYTMQDAYLRND
ncbi:hypothetical protein [Candidatus Electronema sp. JM]|uniref:hypothetical protein n=1 Tax=Candidatus Electronema sp. JM TaxID=3401571 RepID=UPI003AA87276